MNDHNKFWKVMEKCDWRYEGDDDKVLEPVIKYLSQQTDEEIFLFDDMMSELLYAIDTKENAKKSEKAAGYFSDDTFLYSRCVALINDSGYYQSVIDGKADDLWNMEFESLLYVPGQAWSIKHKKDYEDYPHISELSYETGSNKEGWK